MTWRGTSDVGGTKEIVGGMCKFAGIGGAGTWTAAAEQPQPAENIWTWLTDVELNFMLKAAAQ